MTPQNLPLNLKPLQTPPPPQPKPALPALPHVSHWTRHLIDALGLSTAVRNDFLAHVTLVDEPIALADSVPEESPDSSGRSVLKTARPMMRFQTAQPLTWVSSASPVTNDAAQDYEAAVITNRFSGTDRTTTVFMKLDANGAPSHYWSSTTDYVNFTGGPTGRSMFPLGFPTNVTRSADPMLSENPYVAQGAFAKRTYCVGTAYNMAFFNGRLEPSHSELTVWYTNDPGSGIDPWTRLVIDQGENPYFFDKPSVWTSWDSTGATLGYTYVAAVRVNYQTFAKDIVVYRQGANLGFTYLGAPFWSMTNKLSSPIITVDSATGDVYLLWVNWTAGTISIARSTDMGSSFGTAISFSPGRLMDSTSGTITNESKSIVIQAASTIMARPNAADNSIGVIWHQREANGDHADVKFNSFDLARQEWRGVHDVGHVSNDGYDQWNSALDVANDGTYMFTWNDKRVDTGQADTTNRYYRVYAVKANAQGDALDGTDTIVYDAGTADDTALIPVINGVSNVGDYQDLWYWYGTWHGAAVYNGNTASQNIVMPNIRP